MAENYRYKRGQLFAKRLDVPRHILKRIYDCTLNFTDYIQYHLEDKIPTSCIIDYDRKLVDRFGVEKCKNLDWELINGYSLPNARDILMTIEPSEEDVNAKFYDLIQYDLPLYHYTDRMKEFYSDRFFEITNDNDYSDETSIKKLFNGGHASMRDIISWWGVLKDKDLSYCLHQDENNVEHITDSQLREVMSKYKTILWYLNRHIDVYSFVEYVTAEHSEYEIREFIKQYTDEMIDSSGYILPEDYDEFFKYSSIVDVMKKKNPKDGAKIAEELKDLPEDYIRNSHFSYEALFDEDVITAIAEFGLKNIVDFDRDNNGFFSNNDCEVLKKIHMYYKDNYSYVNNDNKNTERTSEEQFYELIRRLFVNGDSSNDYDIRIKLKTIDGKFRELYPELFISKDAPEELQNLFYTKELTPQIIHDHPEYIDYLKDRDFSFGFMKLVVPIMEEHNYHYKNFYSYLCERMGIKEALEFISENAQIIDTLYYHQSSYSPYRPILNENATKEEIEAELFSKYRSEIFDSNIYIPLNLSNSFKKAFPTMFLRDDTPEELQEAYSKRKLTVDQIRNNMEYFENVDIELLFHLMFTRYGMWSDNRDNIVTLINKDLGREQALEVLLEYGNELWNAYRLNSFDDFTYLSGNKENVLAALDRILYKAITSRGMVYNEDFPEHFKTAYPQLFIDEKLDEETKEKYKDIISNFYSKNLKVEDFENNPDLLDVFSNVMIIFGFPNDYSWMLQLHKRINNSTILKIIKAYDSIEDSSLRVAFAEFILDNGYNINPDKITMVTEVLSRLSTSNSSEMYTFKNELARQILSTDNPMESLEKIEDMFIKNNIPTVGKVYSCFEVLHPDFSGFDFEYSNISPVLKMSSTNARKITVFTDMIKASFGSNNLSVIAYLQNLEKGNNIYKSIQSGSLDYDSLSQEDKDELKLFSKHLATMYNNTKNAKKNNLTFEFSDDVVKDIFELSKKLSPDGSLDYDLADRVVYMFCGFTGIETLEEAKEYIASRVETADKMHREEAKHDLLLEKGDLVKGIRDFKYLRSILQNGNLSSNYLGSDTFDDNTPLDADVSIVRGNEGNNLDRLGKEAASSYGPIWVVLKRDDRFIETRSPYEQLEAKRDLSKLELFYTGYMGTDHYGIRTGFASSEIDYILVSDDNKTNDRIGLEIALNGFYIPVVNMDGKVIFTPEDYDNLRSKMCGLSYYGLDKYEFSNNLVTADVEAIASQVEESNRVTKIKRQNIDSIVEQAISKLGLHLKDHIDGDLTDGYVELIDTGSTGRGTNKPGEGDFDFMMRVDRSIINDPEKMNQLKEAIMDGFGQSRHDGEIGTGDFRLKNVDIGNGLVADIDISFSQKTDKINYSTDMALQDRLESIQKQDPEKYEYVIANILLAKQVLKAAGAYKPARGETPQGGLAAVGIENWVLQHGGSFIDAARDFLEAAEGKDFHDFLQEYKVWDFGENHFAARIEENKDDIPRFMHDNFVTANMSESGYNKMVAALKEYLMNVKMAQDNDIDGELNM